jgi:hypothetical protein
MRVFLDFEASSLSDDSYPIEVGWAAEDDSCEAHLIRPAPGWTDWSVLAEATHRLTREALVREGEPHDRVAHRVLEQLAGHEVFVTAPSWDGKWMSVLLRSAGLPRHALRLKPAEQAHRDVVAEVLGDALPAARVAVFAATLLADVRRRLQGGPPRHRALADARSELAVWREVRRLAEDLLRV